MKLKSMAFALVLLAVLSSAAFAAPPASPSQPSQTLLAQIYAPPLAATPAPTLADASILPVLNSICSPCTQANCTRLCHQPAACSFDPDTGCSFCSCFLN